MADDYPLIYTAQGATELVVQSSGLLSMDGSMDISGDVDVESGGSIDVESGATVDFEAGGYWTLPSSEEVVGTTAKNFGISSFDGSTAATGQPQSTAPFYIEAPVAGCLKVLYTTGVSTGYEITVTNSTSVVFESLGSSATTDLHCWSSDSTGNPQVAYLIGLDTSKYMVIAKTSGWVQG